jgi:hypothetical protein
LPERAALVRFGENRRGKGAAGRMALARHGERSGHGQISLKLVLIVLFVLALLAGMAVGAFIVPHAWGP